MCQVWSSAPHTDMHTQTHADCKRVLVTYHRSQIPPDIQLSTLLTVITPLILQSHPPAAPACLFHAWVQLAGCDFCYGPLSIWPVLCGMLGHPQQHYAECPSHSSRVKRRQSNMISKYSLPFRVRHFTVFTVPFKEQKQFLGGTGC
jgi:hypothetical protein